MQFGLSMPNRGPLAKPEVMKEIAVTAEKLGYGYITASDHLVVPRKIDANYPYSETGEFRWSSDGETDCMEQFALLAWIAAVTSTIRVMTSVVVMPHRNPIFMAKSLATTDVLSGGRVTVGCGAGWMPEEFEALNLPPFASRGQVTNEYIDVMKACWSDPNPSYDGEFFKFANVDTDPRRFGSAVRACPRSAARSRMVTPGIRLAAIRSSAWTSWRPIRHGSTS